MDRSGIERVVSGAVSSALSRLSREELALSVNATSQSRNVTDSDVDDEIQEGSSRLLTRKRLLYMTLACTSAALCNVFCSAFLKIKYSSH